MAKQCSVMRELMRAGDVSRQRKSESEPVYLKRIALAVSELRDDVKANLSSEAQAWCRAAVECLREGRMIPSLKARGLGSEFSENQEDVNSDKPLEQTREQDTASYARPDMESKAVRKVASATDRMRRIILENLGKVEKKRMRDLVANAGIAVTNNTFETIYYETHKTMQIAREMGLTK